MADDFNENREGEVNGTQVNTEKYPHQNSSSR